MGPISSIVWQHLIENSPDHKQFIKWVSQHIAAKKNGNHFADNNFNYIFLKENIWLSNEILLKCGPKNQGNNHPCTTEPLLFKI